MEEVLLLCPTKKISRTRLPYLSTQRVQHTWAALPAVWCRVPFLYQETVVMVAVQGVGVGVLLIQVHIPRPHPRPTDLAVESHYLHLEQFPQVLLRPTHVSEPLCGELYPLSVNNNVLVSKHLCREFPWGGN